MVAIGGQYDAKQVSRAFGAVRAALKTAEAPKCGICRLFSSEGNESFMQASSVDRRLTFSLDDNISDAFVARMHEKALVLIEEVGLEVPHRKILSRLSDHDCVRIKGNRVCFDAGAADIIIKSLNYDRESAAFDRPFTRISGAYEMNVRDMKDGRIRTATYADLVDLVKLQDSYNMRGSAPVLPQDIPSAALQEVAMYKACYQHSRWIGQSVFEVNPKSTVAAAEYIYDMAQAIGRPYAIGCWVSSPFRVASDDLEVVYHFLGKNVPMWIATMPIAAATAPIHLVTAYIQSLAELFAGYVMLRLLQGAAYCYCSMIDSVRAYPFDMRYGSFVYGSPEDIQCTVLQARINKYYGIPIIAKSLLTTGKEPDAHAAAEKAAHTIVAGLAGVDGFTNIGLLSVDEIFSAEQVVIDNEILDYVAAFLRGVNVSEEVFSLDAIREVGPGGTFLTHRSTRDAYKSAFWMPGLFRHDMLNHWLKDGAPSLQERARAHAKERIAEHEDPIAEDERRELERIYITAQKWLT